MVHVLLSDTTFPHSLPPQRFASMTRPAVLVPVASPCTCTLPMRVLVLTRLQPPPPPSPPPLLLLLATCCRRHTRRLSPPRRATRCAPCAPWTPPARRCGGAAMWVTRGTALVEAGELEHEDGMHTAAQGLGTPGGRWCCAPCTSSNPVLVPVLVTHEAYAYIYAIASAPCAPWTPPARRCGGAATWVIHARYRIKQIQRSGLNGA